MTDVLLFNFYFTPKQTRLLYLSECNLNTLPPHSLLLILSKNGLASLFKNQEYKSWQFSFLSDNFYLCGKYCCVQRVRLADIMSFHTIQTTDKVKTNGICLDCWMNLQIKLWISQHLRKLFEAPVFVNYSEHKWCSRWTFRKILPYQI